MYLLKVFRVVISMRIFFAILDAHKQEPSNKSHSLSYKCYPCEIEFCTFENRELSLLCSKASEDACILAWILSADFSEKREML